MKQNIKLLLGEKEFILNSGMVFGASFAGAIFLFISNIILSRVFGPELFGNYKTIVALFMFLPALVDFGASPTLTKYIAEFKAKKEEGKINNMILFFLKIKGFSIIFLVSIIWLFRDSFAHLFFKTTELSYLILPGLILSFFILFELSKSIIVGFQNFKLFSFSNFLTAATIGIFTTFFGYYYGIYCAILSGSVGYLIGNLPNIWYLARKNFLHKKKTHLDIAPIFKTYSIPMYGMYLLNMSSMIIIPFLNLFFNQRIIGYYGFAWTFYSGVILIPMAFSQVLFPKVSELNGNKKFDIAKAELKKAFALYTPIAIAGIAGTLMFSKHVVGWIAPVYLPGLLILKTLVCFCLIFGYAQVYRTYLSAKADICGVAVITGIQNIALLLISFIVISLM